ncbi:MAG TPA: MBL fold metallo-hydrolase [Thermodesulfobacteriota bacterium]|nr:MBL fold metallo-hydrolase [Thermodesulfobacteriota bacterium]
MAQKPFEIHSGIYCVGGPDLSHPQDALVYLIMEKDTAALIDAGAGQGSETIWKNISKLGLTPEKLTYLILTHAHVDHIGGAEFFKEKTNCLIVAHEDDRAAIESGDPGLTAASWYGVNLPRLKVDRVLKDKMEALPLDEEKIICLHTPGHTPGSIALYMDRQGKRVLFGQDIHGPFSKSFGSNISDWYHSMEELKALEADILCEGHFGIFRTPEKVKKYIEQYQKQYG